MNLNLEGKWALVSGSYRGTGAIIAERLAAEGVRVLVHGLHAGQAEPIAARIPGAVAVCGDITNEAGTAQLVEACQAVTPTLDILINNYGTSERGTWRSTTSADWIDLYQKNVLSAQRLIQAFTPGMVARGWGRVLNLGTTGSTKPNATSPHYYAAKGALATLTVSLARELGPQGVGVNLVSPGLIRTPEVEEAFLRTGHEKGWGTTWAEVEPHVARDAPIGRIATREEVADLLVFLCSPRAAAIHGQNIRIDGGTLALVN